LSTLEEEAAASTFSQATASLVVDERRASIRIDQAWCYHGHPHGGYLLATLLRATAAVAHRDDIITATCQFARSPRPGPAEVSVDAVRVGRQVAQLRSTMSQDGAVVLDAAVTCLTRQSPPGRLPGTIPLPLPHGCRAVEPRTVAPGIAQRVTVRYDPAGAPSYPLRTDGPPRISGWVSLTDGAEPDRYVAVLAADVLPPTVRNFGVAGWTPTLHSTVTFRADPAPGPLAVVQTARQIDTDLFDEYIEVLDSQGVLVVQAHQVSVIRAASASRAATA
jgi:Thioesterase-like superfamily